MPNAITQAPVLPASLVTAGRSALTEFAKWLAAPRTSDELAEARIMMKDWEAALGDIDKNVRERLKERVLQDGKQVSDATLRLKTAYGYVDLTQQRAKNPDEGLLRALCKAKSLDYEAEAADQTVIFPPSPAKVAALVSAGKLTEEEVKATRPVREVLKVT